MYHVNSSQCHVSELNTHEMTSVDLHFLAAWRHNNTAQNRRVCTRQKVCTCNVIYKLLTRYFTLLFHVIMILM